MIIGVGCDIVDHTITKKLEWSSNLRVQKRIFSAKEIELSQGAKMVRFLSGRFAAKEAVLKCLGTGMRDGIALTDVQILQTIAGQPYIQLKAEVENIAREMGVFRWHVSISHTDHSSCAFVIAENQ